MVLIFVLVFWIDGCLLCYNAGSLSNQWIIHDLFLVAVKAKSYCGFAPNANCPCKYDSGFVLTSD